MTSVETPITKQSLDASLKSGAEGVKDLIGGGRTPFEWKVRLSRIKDTLKLMDQMSENERKTIRKATGDLLKDLRKEVDESDKPTLEATIKAVEDQKSLAEKATDQGEKVVDTLKTVDAPTAAAIAGGTVLGGTVIAKLFKTLWQKLSGTKPDGSVDERSFVRKWILLPVAAAAGAFGLVKVRDMIKGKQQETTANPSAGPSDAPKPPEEQTPGQPKEKPQSPKPKEKEEKLTEQQLGDKGKTLLANVEKTLGTAEASTNRKLFYDFMEALPTGSYQRIIIGVLGFEVDNTYGFSKKLKNDKASGTMHIMTDPKSAATFRGVIFIRDEKSPKEPETMTEKERSDMRDKDRMEKEKRVQYLTGKGQECIKKIEENLHTKDRGNAVQELSDFLGDVPNSMFYAVTKALGFVESEDQMLVKNMRKDSEQGKLRVQLNRQSLQYEGVVYLRS